MDLHYDAIRSRRSSRSYDGMPLSPADILAIEACFEGFALGPFGGRSRFVLVSADLSGLYAHDHRAVQGRIGTYGLITKVPAFVVGAIKKGPRALEDFGFSMEGIVLRITELGLGSCWIGGIFDRSAAARALGIATDEYMPAVVALGAEAEKRSIAERFTRMSARAGTRKPWDSLFFDGDFANPLAVEEEGQERDLLEAVRLDPSASNRQPWRIVRARGSTRPPEGATYHLYLDEDPIYNSALGEIHIQNIDMGIAMRHFEVAARHLRLPGAWTRLEEDPLAAGRNQHYIATWRPD